MKWLCIRIIRFYRRVLSPLKKQPTCRFYPTCSGYALEAFEKRGFFAGLILTVGRIARCQPFGRAGYDPVPEKGLRAYVNTTRRMTKYYYPEEYGIEHDGKEDVTQ